MLFYVNYSLQKVRKRKTNIQEPDLYSIDLNETTHPTREQDTFNEQHRGLRSRVEAPFWAMEAALRGTWNPVDSKLGSAGLRSLHCSL